MLAFNSTSISRFISNLTASAAFFAPGTATSDIARCDGWCGTTSSIVLTLESDVSPDELLDAAASSLTTRTVGSSRGVTALTLRGIRIGGGVRDAVTVLSLSDEEEVCCAREKTTDKSGSATPGVLGVGPSSADRIKDACSGESEGWKGKGDHT
jgi:hypothetical protein